MTTARSARVGIIGTDNSHAFQYAGLLNGWDHAEPIPTRVGEGPVAPGLYDFARTLRTVERYAPTGSSLSRATVTRIWSDNVGDAQRIARACGVDEICGEPSEACRDVDAVMILTEDPGSHLEHATTAFSQHVRTYIDKPLAADLEQAKTIARLARLHDAEWYSGSSIRWSWEIEVARASIRASLDRLRAIYVQAPLGFALYGIHAIETASAFLGADVRNVRGIRTPGRETVVLAYEHGETATCETIGTLSRPSHNAILYGHLRDLHVDVRDYGGLALAFVRRFAAWACGNEPTPVEEAEILRLMEISQAAREALDTGGQISLQPYRADSTTEAPAGPSG